MIEISLWVLVVMIEVLVVTTGLAFFFGYRVRSQRRRFERRVGELQAALNEAQSSVSLDVDFALDDQTESLDPPIGRSLRPVLLSDQDVAAAARSEGRGGGADSSELLATAIDGHQWLNDRFNSVLERSQALATLLLKATKSGVLVDEATRTQLQLAIDHMRETDEILASIADKGVELDETLHFLQATTLAPGRGPVDRVSLNEILIARAEGQTEAELTALRQEVRLRLQTPATPVVDPAAAERANALGRQVTDLKAKLEKEKSDLERTQAVLADVTAEYQRLFEQFQSTA